jgi:hypothetical protein
MKASILYDSFRGPRNQGIPCSLSLAANASISKVVKWGIMPTPLGSPFFSKSHGSSLRVAMSHKGGYFALYPGDCRDSQTRWRRGADLNSHYPPATAGGLFRLPTRADQISDWEIFSIAGASRARPKSCRAPAIWRMQSGRFRIVIRGLPRGSRSRAPPSTAG